MAAAVVGVSVPILALFFICFFESLLRGTVSSSISVAEKMKAWRLSASVLPTLSAGNESDTSSCEMKGREAMFICNVYLFVWLSCMYFKNLAQQLSDSSASKNRALLTLYVI